MSKQASQVKPQVTQSNSEKIFYKGIQEIDHHLFKLQPSDMRKNVSFTTIPRYEYFSHSHIFHSVDSSGNQMDGTNAVGGHFHKVEVIYGLDGEVPTVSCSGPLEKIRKTIDGVPKVIAVPVEGDTHTHDVKYLGSERITIRKFNPEYVKFEAQMAAKRPARVEGITER